MNSAALTYDSFSQIAERWRNDQLLPAVGGLREQGFATNLIVNIGSKRVNELCNPLGQTAAHIAAINGDTFVLLGLFFARADFTIIDKEGRSVRNIIKSQKKLNDFRKYLLNGVFSSEQAMIDQAALVAGFTHCLGKNHLEELRTLVAESPFPIKKIINTHNEFGLTFLQTVCYERKLDLPIVQFLVAECGADPNIRVKDKDITCADLLHYREVMEKEDVTEVRNYLIAQGLENDRISSDFKGTIVRDDLLNVRVIYARLSGASKEVVNEYNHIGLTHLQNILYAGPLDLQTIRFLVEDCGANLNMLSAKKVTTCVDLLKYRERENGEDVTAVLDYLVSRGLDFQNVGKFYATIDSPDWTHLFENDAGIF